MLQITRDPSSGSSIQCLVKSLSRLCNTHMHSSLERHSPRPCSTHTVPLYTVQYTHSASLHCAVNTHTTGKYAAITPTTSISTDTIEPLL